MRGRNSAVDEAGLGGLVVRYSTATVTCDDQAVDACLCLFLIVTSISHGGEKSG